uniref:Myb/SANT-like DNA-binding domain-containing protein n=1 Tax=Xenopus tropicalis TaxID=8364 RepID=A0A803KE10_XENTR
MKSFQEEKNMAEQLTDKEFQQLLQFLPFIRAQSTIQSAGSLNNAPTATNLTSVVSSVPQLAGPTIILESTKSASAEPPVPEENLICQGLSENTSTTDKAENVIPFKKCQSKSKHKSVACDPNVLEYEELGNNLRNQCEDLSSSEDSEDLKGHSKSGLIESSQKRMSKFSDEELEVLIREVTEKYEMLYGSLASKLTNQRKKQIWETIRSKVCAVGVKPRSIIQLKKRWLDIRRRTKDKLGQLEKIRHKTGGGEENTASLNRFETQVQETIPELLIKGDSTLDSSDLKSVGTYAQIEKLFMDEDAIQDTNNEDIASTSKIHTKPFVCIDSQKKVILEEMLHLCKETGPAQDKCLNVLNEILSVSKEQLKLARDNSNILQSMCSSMKSVELAFLDFLKLERHLVLAVETDKTDYIVDDLNSSLFESDTGDLPKQEETNTIELTSKPNSPLSVTQKQNNAPNDTCLVENLLSQQDAQCCDGGKPKCDTEAHSQENSQEPKLLRRSTRKRKCNVELASQKRGKPKNIQSNK